MLSDSEIERYARQIVLPEVGGVGQERLRRSSVSLHVAATTDGVVQSAILAGLHLAVAGVGRLRIDPLSPNAERTRAALTALVSERDPSIAISIDSSPTEALVAVGALSAVVPATPIACAVLDSHGPSLLVAGSERFCVACWNDAIAGRDPTDDWPTLSTSLAAALLATLALRSLLGLDRSGGLDIAIVGLGPGVVPRASSRTHRCRACLGLRD